MKWNYLEFAINPADADLATACVWEWGSTGLQELPLESGQIQIKAFFPKGASATRVKQSFLRHCRQTGIKPQRVRTAQEPEKDWLKQWRASLAPFALGKHFYLIPSERGITPVPRTRTPIWLEPGMAFGTGTHETTRLCLHAIEDCLKPGHALLDVGTGSGLLAIAARKLGAGKVAACDIDAVAIDVAQANALINDCTDPIDWTLGDVRAVKRGRFDLVVANLTVDPIEADFRFLERRVKPAGYLILSGILETQASRIRAKIKGSSLRLRQLRQDGEWVCFILKRSTTPAKPK